MDTSFTNSYGATTATEFEFVNHATVKSFNTFDIRSPEPMRYNESFVLHNNATMDSTSHKSQLQQQHEFITVNGITGLWVNKSESLNWTGPIPLSEYQINEDPNPEIIRKKPDQQLVYNQEIAVRYLRPPTPPPAGDIIIREEASSAPPPAPPLVIRQEAPRPETPAPIIIREMPPRLPESVSNESKIITIPGRSLPAPPRRIIVERLPALPTRPQAIIVERWLPYKKQRRRVILTRCSNAAASEPAVECKKEKNVVIQWEAPEVRIKKDFKDLGVVRVNPQDYIEKYGSELKAPSEIPEVVKELKLQRNVQLASETIGEALHELIGDIHALSLIDLEKEGLAEYRTQLQQQQPLRVDTNTLRRCMTEKNSQQQQQQQQLRRVNSDSQNTGKTLISIQEAKEIVQTVNAKIDRHSSDPRSIELVKTLDMHPSNKIDLEDFKTLLKAYV